MPIWGAAKNVVFQLQSCWEILSRGIHFRAITLGGVQGGRQGDQQKKSYFKNPKKIKIKNKKEPKEEGVPTVAQWIMNLFSIMRMQVRSLTSLNGLRIRHCHELWYRSQMQFESRVVVAMTSTCCRCSPQNQSKARKTRKKEPREELVRIDWMGGSDKIGWRGVIYIYIYIYIYTRHGKERGKK